MDDTPRSLGRFERWTLRTNAKQYGGTYKYRRTQVLALIGLVGSLLLTRIGLDATPEPSLAYFGGFGIALFAVMLLAALQGPILAPYMDTDRMTADLSREASNDRAA